MTQTLAILLIAAVLMGYLVTGVAMSTKQALVFSATVFAVFLGAAVAIMCLRGTPKDLSAETARPEAAEVVWFWMDQKRGVLLLLKWDAIPEPKYYKTGWKEETEHQLEQASREARVNHGLLMLRHPFGGSGKAGSGGAESADGGARSGAQGIGESSADNRTSDNPFYAAPPPPPEEKR